MALYKRGGTWWYEFVYAGKRIRESAKTSRKTIAAEAERNRRLELEKALAGLPAERRDQRINSVADLLKPYIEHYGVNHRPASVAFLRSCASNLQRLLGRELLPDLTESRIRKYMSDRLDEGAAGRTVNAELGELSRAIGKPWSALWPRVRKIEERKDVGRALSNEEEARLVEAADQSSSPVLKTLIRVALMTGMRAGELTSLTWAQVDLAKRVITVGRSKTAAGTGRQIPMNDSLFHIVAAHANWYTARFGEALTKNYLFPFGSPVPKDPTRPTVELKTAWNTVRKAAGVNCRWHDLRHTACTKLAEAGVPEFIMEALMGHMSRAMLNRYSHIRLQAMREAVQALRPSEVNPNGIPTKAHTPSVVNVLQ